MSRPQDSSEIADAADRDEIPSSVIVDGASADSFPASDPPSSIPMMQIGCPRHDFVREAAGISVSPAAAEAPTRDDEADAHESAIRLGQLLSSRDNVMRRQGYVLFRELLEDALYRSCLNYSGLVRGFTHPVLDAVARAIENWAAAYRAETASAETVAMNIAIPEPLKAEHEELHAELAAATKLQGPVGAAAREVARLLHPHFLKEEEIALPPLGLLSALAQNMPAGEMIAVTKMTDRLRRDLPDMLTEHAAILRALEALAAAAREAGDEASLRFAHKLATHAKIEETVMYPAAILVGELVKGRIAQAFD